MLACISQPPRRIASQICKLLQIMVLGSSRHGRFGWFPESAVTALAMLPIGMPDRSTPSTRQLRGISARSFWSPSMLFASIVEKLDQFFESVQISE
jgi:hypothetical protein